MLPVQARSPASIPSGPLGNLFSGVKTSERDMARNLRSEGLSVREIERAIGVSRSTASLWVRDIELTPEQREHLLVRPRGVRTDFRRRRREQCQEKGRAAAQGGEVLHAIGCMLFWAEGSEEHDRGADHELRPCVAAARCDVPPRYFAV